MAAEGIHISKAQNSNEEITLNQSHNVEGKICFLDKMSYLKWIHKDIDPERRHPQSFQKIWEAIQMAKSEKLNLDVVWLELVNAYGSVPHQMTHLPLRMYHVLEDIQVMLNDYFSD